MKKTKIKKIFGFWSLIIHRNLSPSFHFDAYSTAVLPSCLNFFYKILVVAEKPRVKDIGRCNLNFPSLPLLNKKISLIDFSYCEKQRVVVYHHCPSLPWKIVLSMSSIIHCRILGGVSSRSPPTHNCNPIALLSYYSITISFCIKKLAPKLA